jgi:hypothetical protein
MMTGREQVHAARDALARARAANELLRSSRADGTVWIGAIEDTDDGGATEGNQSAPTDRAA